MEILNLEEIYDDPMNLQRDTEEAPTKSLRLQYFLSKAVKSIGLCQSAAGWRAGLFSLIKQKAIGYSKAE